jgi:hypothetical protein
LFQMGDNRKFVFLLMVIIYILRSRLPSLPLNLMPLS